MQISEVKEYLQMGEESTPEDDDEVSSAPSVSGPVLLFGNAIFCTKTALLAALPTRTVADRFVSFYLNSKEAPLGTRSPATSRRLNA